jgi:hypothetical protein
VINCLAGKAPDLSAQDPEVVWRLKKNHAGLILASPD